MISQKDPGQGVVASHAGGDEAGGEGRFYHAMYAGGETDAAGGHARGTALAITTRAWRARLTADVRSASQRLVTATTCCSWDLTTASNSPAGTGRANKKPWPTSQPSSSRAAAC
jgi:hypothetical protein